MAAIEERMALLEGRMVEQAHMFGEIRNTLRSLDRRMDGVEQRLTAVDQRLTERMTGLDQKVDRLAATLEESTDTTRRSMGALHESVMTTLHASLAGFRAEAATDFRWIVGIQLTTLIAVVAALLGALVAR